MIDQTYTTGQKIHIILSERDGNNGKIKNGELHHKVLLLLCKYFHSLFSPSYERIHSSINRRISSGV
jgi:hypothetical protein